MRVGALPQHPTGLLGYAFNWSPEGVVNEYLNDCEVIEEGQHKWVSSMEWIETIYVNGVKLEAFTTSGGLGTMCETFLDRVENLDYKTMRYPGHVKQYLRHLGGVNWLVNPPQFSHLGNRLINKNRLWHFRK
jgi:saccharopine dehydrogenase (NAD+, L-lysine-forming)